MVGFLDFFFFLLYIVQLGHWKARAVSGGDVICALTWRVDGSQWNDKHLFSQMSNRKTARETIHSMVSGMWKKGALPAEDVGREAYDGE